MLRAVLLVPSCLRQGLGALLLLAGVASAQNLLVNGDFESNDRTSYASYSPPPNDYAYLSLAEALPGWTFSHSVDLYGPTNSPQHGAQFLDLVGGGPLGTSFSIQQTFATVIGNTYRLDFFYGNNEAFSVQGGQASFNASLTGSSLLWSGGFTHSGDTMTVRNWTEFTVDFVADSASTTLTFLNTYNLPASWDPANYTVAGATLDNVSVIMIVPEPGGWTMALAVGGIFLAALLNSRRARAKRVAPLP